MNRTFTYAVLAGLALGAIVGSVILSAGPADADRTVVLSTSKAQITHGHFARQEDGGWFFRVWGRTEQTDGGAAAVEQPFVDCSVARFQDAPVTCRDAWREANGL